MEKWTKDIYIKKIDAQIQLLYHIQKKITFFLNDFFDTKKNDDDKLSDKLYFCFSAVADIVVWFNSIKPDIENEKVTLNFLKIISGQIKRVDEIYKLMGRLETADDFFSHGLELTYSYFEFFSWCSQYHDVFKQTDYFPRNCVIGGAAGVGKTSFCLMLKNILGADNCVYISSERLANIWYKSIDPEELDIDKAANESNEKRVRFDYNVIYRGVYSLEDYFTDIPVELPEELTSVLDDFWRRNGKVSRLTAIFNEIFAPLRLYFTSDYRPYILKNVTLRNYPDENINSKSAISHPLEVSGSSQLAAAYLICKILLSPKRGFIIVDNPDLFLTATVSEKLWNLLQQERKDCIFVFATSNSDFVAANRNSDKYILTKFCSDKVVKSLDYNNMETTCRYKLLKLSQNQLPIDVQFKLLSAGKKILFLHQPLNSFDIKPLIENALRRDFVVYPLNTAEEVIFYTKFFNSYKNRPKNAFGVVLNGFLSDIEAEKLKKERIFNVDYFGWEAIFADKKNLLIFYKFFDVDYQLNMSDVFYILEKYKKGIANKIATDKILFQTQIINRKILLQQNSNIDKFFDNLPQKNDFASTKKSLENDINRILNKKNILEAKNYIIGINCLKIIAKKLNLTLDLLLLKSEKIFSNYSSAKKIVKNFLPPFL